MSKLQPVYCISSMQIYFLFTKQIFQSRLRVEGNKSSSIFCDKSIDAILSTTPNHWDNIQIVRTHILKHDVLNSMSLGTKCLDFETLYHCFGHASDKIIYHILNNIEDVKKICFLIQKCIYYNCTLSKIYQHSFLENSICSNKLLGLIHSDLLELPTLSYSKYKCVITFLDDYFSYCNIAFLYKKSETVEVIKSTF